ncbi:MAG: acetylglutamate kinase [Candidatus Omnitrophica bacterium]|nr:acetylglutamate kinase [Candidatus Omnitrophota bacterium]
MVEEAIRKADVLIEALPYIRSFRNKIVVIKYGGSAMTDVDKRKIILQDIEFMYSVRMRPVLVHGGGPFISEKMRQAGYRPEFIDGIRVTDKKAMEIVAEALTEINTELVHRLKRLGVSAKGTAKIDLPFIKVRKYKPNKKIDLGYVGKIVAIDTGPIKEIINEHAIPVIVPIGVDETGALYNVNADDAASEVAYYLKAEKLVLLTDVKGIMRDPGDSETLISTLNTTEAEQLIARKIIQQGMIPKVRACFRALEGEVRKTHIIDGRLLHSLLLEIFTDKGVGTEIVRTPEEK